MIPRTSKLEVDITVRVEIEAGIDLTYEEAIRRGLVLGRFKLLNGGRTVPAPAPSLDRLETKVERFRAELKEGR